MFQRRGWARPPWTWWVPRAESLLWWRYLPVREWEKCLHAQRWWRLCRQKNIFKNEPYSLDSFSVLPFPPSFPFSSFLFRSMLTWLSSSNTCMSSVPPRMNTSFETQCLQYKINTECKRWMQWWPETSTRLVYIKLVHMFSSVLTCLRMASRESSEEPCPDTSWMASGERGGEGAHMRVTAIRCEKKIQLWWMKKTRRRLGGLVETLLC